MDERLEKEETPEPEPETEVEPTVEEPEPETEEAAEPHVKSAQREQTEMYRKLYKELTDIEGIGEATLQRLNEGGIRTVESLSTSTQHELEEMGLGEETATKIIIEARKAIHTSFITATEVMDMKEIVYGLTTGCDALDIMMEPGLPSQSISQFYGEFGSGKSQFIHQLCVTCQLPESEGGLGGNVLLIDTEGIFSPKRLLQIAERYPKWFPDPKAVLEGVIYAEAYTSAHQIGLLANCDQLIKDNNIKAIFIDGVMSHFRGEYLGREMLANRQQQLNKHLTKLAALTRTFNLVGVVTNQVSAKPDAYSGGRPVPIGGHILGHKSHTIIYIRKGRHNLRIAAIVASPFYPDGEATLRITDRGMEDVEDYVRM